jgi:hypothetical protein
VSSPLAIAAVTAVLKDLLNNGLIDNDLAVVGSVSVTAMPPDRITTGPTEPNRLNLFLYQVTPNIGWRNAALPSHSSTGERLTNPPLALDLHYLLSAYGDEDFNAEILLGYAMELMHNTGIIGRTAIRRSLDPNNPIKVALIPDDGEGRKAIDLADQLETIKITPHYLSADELSRMWTAMQARYRPTVAYQVSTVLIQSTRPVRSRLPVLKRGEDDKGIICQPNIDPPPSRWPLIEHLEIVTNGGLPRLAAELGDTIVLKGAQLSGAGVTAIFRHSLLDAPIERRLEVGSTASRGVVTLPAIDTNTPPDTWEDWPCGSWTVSLRIREPGKPERWTNEISFQLAARLFAAPQVTGDGANPGLSLRVFPRLWPGQRVDVYVGDQAFQPAALDTNTSQLALPITGVIRSEVEVPVRVRVDGVDSILVRDRSLPQFDPKQVVSLPV